jgi:hypothetical protein
MRYSSGQDIREGDEVRIQGRVQSGRVVQIILPGTLEARDWSAPDGGVLIEGAGLGLSLTVHPERDPELVLVRRSS